MSSGLQLIGNRHPGWLPADSGFGSGYFGWAPFGGAAFRVEEMPTVQVGSDEISKSRRRRVAEVVHRRHGLLVGRRVFNTGHRAWTINYNVVAESVVDVLEQMFLEREFYLLPDTDYPESRITVAWVGDEFHPRLVKPGFYAISFDIEEVL